MPSKAAGGRRAQTYIRTCTLNRAAGGRHTQTHVHTYMLNKAAGGRHAQTYIHTHVLNRSEGVAPHVVFAPKNRLETLAFDNLTGWNGPVLKQQCSKLSF